ncbi:I78 family peptidase inhibitor [Paracoccus sp. (in: a-proteobacteria)]|uniref:I78 family peptidase inhibitor n=1 Tax=Paracoccus sp. TaxID=267 RepID=UPI0028AF7FE8|nr:I78 family peptidase inhibitor [Paracoccus sp. (in: a-proteobacteria)]
MKLSLSLAVLAAPFVLAACTPEAPPPEEPIVSIADPCGAARYSHLVGQTSPTISVPEGQMYRIARQDQPMTMEMIQDRLTFIVDSRGKLLSVSCS